MSALRCTTRRTGEAVLTAAVTAGTLLAAGGVGQAQTVSCSYRHSSTTLTTCLEASNGSTTWTAATAQTTCASSVGTGSDWRCTTSSSCDPALAHQTVAVTTLSGVGSSRATTGAPRRVC